MATISHAGCMDSPRHNSERRPLMTISQQFGPHWPSSFRGNYFLSEFLQIFYFQQWLPSSLAGRVVGYNSERGPYKDHLTIVWAHLTQQFQRSFLCDFLPNFLCLIMATSQLATGVVGQISERGSPKDHSTIVWAQLAQQFQRR